MISCRLCHSDWKEDTSVLKVQRRPGAGIPGLLFKANRDWEGLVKSAWQTDLTLSCGLFFAVRTHYLRDTSPSCNSANASQSACRCESGFAFQLDCFFLYWDILFVLLSTARTEKQSEEVTLCYKCWQKAHECAGGFHAFVGRAQLMDGSVQTQHMFVSITMSLTAVAMASCPRAASPSGLWLHSGWNIFNSSDASLFCRPGANLCIFSVFLCIYLSMCLMLYLNYAFLC